MSIKDLNAGTASHYIDRINAISGDTPRVWGTMTPAQMCAHMSLSIEGGLGEVDFKDRGNFVIRLMLPVIFSGVIPMPKGRAKTAPEYVAPDTAEFQPEQDRLLKNIQRFLDDCESNPGAKHNHPFFGMMNVAQWQRGHALHLNHHLQQFGV